MTPISAPTIDYKSFPIAQLQCETDTGIDTIPLALEQSFPSWQTSIPERYTKMDAEELSRRILDCKAKGPAVWDL